MERWSAGSDQELGRLYQIAGDSDKANCQIGVSKFLAGRASANQAVVATLPQLFVPGGAAWAVTGGPVGSDFFGVNSTVRSLPVCCY